MLTNIRHWLPCNPQGLENHAYDTNQFVSAWADLWKKVSCLPNFQADIANRVFIDVMNEPDSMNIVWEPSSGRPGAHQLYLGTADALWQLTPDKVMFFMEGECFSSCGGVFHCIPDSAQRAMLNKNRSNSNVLADHGLTASTQLPS